LARSREILVDDSSLGSSRNLGSRRRLNWRKILLKEIDKDPDLGSELASTWIDDPQVRRDHFVFPQKRNELTRG
jgi:hypothetical protein